MALPYQFWRSTQGSRSLPKNLQLEVNVNYVDGQPLIWSNLGKLTAVAANTDRPMFILNGSAQSGALGSLENLGSNPTVLNQIGNGFNAQAGPGGNQQVAQVGAFADVFPVAHGQVIWRVSFVPIYPATVASASGSPTSIILPNSPRTYALHDFRGGTILDKTTGQQFRIADSSAATAGNPMTFTIIEPIGKIGATINADGHTFVASPLGPGMTGYKFGTISGTVAGDGFVPSQLGTTSGDASGGFIQIEDIDLLNNYAFVIFN